MKVLYSHPNTPKHLSVGKELNELIRQYLLLGLSKKLQKFQKKNEMSANVVPAGEEENFLAEQK